MEKKYILGSFAILVVLLVSGFAFAYQGNPEIKGPDFSEERHAAMQETFDNLDYSGWVELMTREGKNPRIIEVITEENFDEFVEAHNAAINGDFEALKEFRQSLGLGLGQMKHGSDNSFGKGNCLGNGSGRMNRLNA